MTVVSAVGEEEVRLAGCTVFRRFDFPNTNLDKSLPVSLGQIEPAARFM
jgi:hypothetical protein